MTKLHGRVELGPLLLLTLGAGFLAAAVYAFLDLRAILTTWPEVTAKVTQSRVFPGPANRRIPFRAEWEFTYTVNGREYRTPFVSSSTSGNFAARQAEADEFPLGAKVRIRYDPADPNDIRPRARWSPGFFLLPAIIGLAGVIVTPLSVVLLRRSRRNRLTCASCGAQVEKSFRHCPRCAARLPFEEAGEQDRVSAGSRRPSMVAALLIGGIGVGFLFFGLRLLWQQLDIIRSWPEVDAIVRSAELSKYRGARGELRYDVRIEVAYSWQGVPVIIRSGLKPLSASASPGSYVAARRRLDTFAAGSHQRLRVNPSDPSDIRFDARYSFDFLGMASLLSLAGLVSAAVAIGLLRSATRKPLVCKSCAAPRRTAYRYCPNCGRAA